MLKKIVFSFALIVLCLPSFSQLRGGIKFGGSSSSFVGYGVSNFSTQQKSSIHGGAVIHFDIISRFSLQTELLYTRKGAPVEFTSENQVYKGDIDLYPKLGYFSVPLLLQFNLGKNPSSKFHLDFGMYNSWLVDKSYTGSRTFKDNNGIEKTVDFSIPSTFSGQDFGFTFGLGLLAGRVMFDFRYDLGRKNIFAATEGIPSLQNRTFMISLGYFFND